MAIVSLFCCFFSVSCRCCSVCCNCCLDNDDELFERSKSIRCRVYFVIVWLSILVACMVGFVGASNASRGLNNFGFNVQHTVDEITCTTLEISNLALLTSNLTTVSTTNLVLTLGQFSSGVTSISAQLADTRSLLKTYIDLAMYVHIYCLLSANPLVGVFFL